MPTTSDVRLLSRAQRELAVRSQRELRRFWAALDLERPERVRDELLSFVPALTAAYGAAGAVVAADWYDEVRAAEGVPGRFRAVMAEPFPDEFVQARVRYGARHLFTEAPGRALPFLTGAVQEYVIQPARDTISRSSMADPRASGWHRQAQADACSFCRMLVGRGGVYRRESAAFAAHAHCNCVAVPSWDPDAPEVPVVTYTASERNGALRARAARGNKPAQRALEDNRRRVREHIAANY